MKLKDYIKALNNLIEEHPKARDLEVVYSIDDEGNGYSKIHHTATLAQFHNIKDYELELVGFFSGDEHIDERDCNAVCIN